MRDAYLGLGGGRGVAHIERLRDGVLRAALEELGHLLADGHKLDLDAEVGELLVALDSLREVGKEAPVLSRTDQARNTARAAEPAD